jgi:hypothetical protein
VALPRVEIAVPVEGLLSVEAVEGQEVVGLVVFRSWFELVSTVLRCRTLHLEGLLLFPQLFSLLVNG